MIILQVTWFPYITFFFRLDLEFSGREIRSSVVFNPAEDTSLAREEAEGSELKGPVVRLAPLADANRLSLLKQQFTHLQVEFCEKVMNR